MRVRGLILSAVLIFIQAVCLAQQRNWDEALDRYELICARCVELMEQEKTGQNIPKESLSSLIVQLNLLKNSLSEGQGQMSAAQKARFEMIRNHFATAAGKGTELTTGTASGVSQSGKRTATAPKKVPSQAPPPVQTEPDTADTAVRETWPAITGLKMSSPAVTDFKTGISAGAPVPGTGVSVQDPAAIAGRKRPDILVSAQIGCCPTLSYGLMAGVTGPHWGGYVKYRDNFRHARPEYECDLNGVLPDGSEIMTDGTSAKQRMTVTAGGIRRFGKWAGIYAGAGYGAYSYTLIDYAGRPVAVTGLNSRGLALECGLIGLWGHFYATLGTNLTAFKYTDLEAGVGVRF